MKVRLEDRHQHQIDGHLHHTVFHRGNAQLAEPSARFGNARAAHRQRPVRFAVQLFPQRTQPCCFHLRVHGDRFDGDPIDTRRAPVRFHPPPGCFQHVGPLHLSIQTPEPVLRFGLRLPIQGDLQLPDFFGCC
jgi:hypothetical protein